MWQKKGSARLVDKLSLKVRLPLASVALIWSWVQFDFCLSVIGLTLTSPLGRAMKLVIHLRKGQCQTQPFAKYNVRRAIHGIWKPGSPFTFGLFEMSNLCQVTRLNPHTSSNVSGVYKWGKLCLLKALLLTVMVPSSTALVYFKETDREYVRKPTGVSKGQRIRPICQNRVRLNSPFPQRHCCEATKHPQGLRWRWRWGWRLDYNDWHLWKRAWASARTISKRISWGTVWPDCY